MPLAGGGNGAIMRLVVIGMIHVQRSTITAMARRIFPVLVVVVAVGLALAACNALPAQVTAEPTVAVEAGDPTGEAPAAPTSAEPTAPPTVEVEPAATEEATEEFTEEATGEGASAGPLLAVLTPDGAVEVVDLATGEATLIAEPSFDIMTVPHRPIAVTRSALYVLGYDFSEGLPPQVYAITPAGEVTLRDEFGPLPTGLAATEAGGGAGYLAWSIFDWTAEPPSTGLYITALGDMNTLTVAEQQTPEGWNFVPVRWSTDGQRLYYVEEPTGLGGYILFDGYSSLYVYDMGTGEASVVVPNSRAGLICIDDLSPDEQFIAHHCDLDRVAVTNLETGESTEIAAPPDVTDATLAGSAVFSPDGSRVAFGLARGTPEDERGYLVVTDDLGGTSRLLTTTQESAVYRVLAWLDADTLLVEQSGADNTLWTVPVSGGEPQYLTKGQMLALLPAGWLSE